MTYAQQCKWLGEKHRHDARTPMGQFHVSGGDLLWTASWPIYGGYGGYSFTVKTL